MPAIHPDPFAMRQERLAEAIEKHGLEALALNPGPSLTYLTGLHFHLSERPVLALFSPGKVPALMLPQLELAKTHNLPFEIMTYPYGEDPATWGGVFRKGASALNLDGRRIGVEPRQMRVLELRLLEASIPEAELLNGEMILASLRMCKDETEIAAMLRAAQIAEGALEATLPFIKKGVRERDLSAELVLQLLRAGSDGEMPFMPIVSGGPNSANPHATPSERPLQEGDLLVIDWGASYLGYFSDITRTFAIGEVDPEYRHIADVVLAANTAGRAACQPGVAAQTVDQAARKVIEQAGYGEYFTHRTGHGLGMEGHEAPYIREGNDLELKPGMTFTVEPGIYLTGRNGVRIEDDIVITSEGAESLTSLPRSLRTL